MVSKKFLAAVTTYGDHEVIVPENELRKAISDKPLVRGADDDPIARAEQALAGLSGEFSSWMDFECERLDKARVKVGASGWTCANEEALFHRRARHRRRGRDVRFSGYGGGG